MRKITNLIVEDSFATHTKAKQLREYIILFKTLGLGFLMAWGIVFVLRVI